MGILGIIFNPILDLFCKSYWERRKQKTEEKENLIQAAKALVAIEGFYSQKKQSTEMTDEVDGLYEASLKIKDEKNKDIKSELKDFFDKYRNANPWNRQIMTPLRKEARLLRLKIEKRIES